MSKTDEIEVGDLVKCINSISVKNGGPRKGECFIVTSISADGHAIGFPLNRLNTRTYYNSVIQGNKANWGIPCFELVVKKDNKAVKVLFNEK